MDEGENHGVDLTQRECQVYSPEEVAITKQESKIVLDEIILLDMNKKSVIYTNQQSASLFIMAKLMCLKILCLLVYGLTQSGKTGCMSAMIKDFIYHNVIPIENIYIITGLSSKDWMKQTKFRFPKYLQDRVFHRNKLLKDFLNDIKGKQNVLIIIDEIHIAAKTNQTLYKVFEEAGFFNKQYLFRHDVKIVEFSATPDGIIRNLMDWGEHSTVIKMDPGVEYTSVFDLRDAGRIRQFKDLCGYNKKTGKINPIVYENIDEIRDTIYDKYTTPRYHIIRTPTGNLQDVVKYNFHKIFGDNVDYKTYDSKSMSKGEECVDINDIIRNPPNKHTFIFIMERMRCAKTLIKTHIGILYERHAKALNDSVIIQGLAGRATGYEDDGNSIIFTNIDTIDRYKTIWDSGFEDRSIKWKSNTTVGRGKNTVNDPANIPGMGTGYSSVQTSKEPVVKEFDSFEEAKPYILATLGSHKRPKRRKLNADGFYESVIRGDRQVRTIEQIKVEKKYGLGNSGDTYRLFYCYTDITDKDSVKVLVIHK